MISIVNYGMGNIRSVMNALKYLGVKCCVIDRPEQILKSTKLVLPGVGSFKKAMDNIKKNSFQHALDEAVLDSHVPLLGICLGMQLLAESSEEGGFTHGLGWIKGSVKRIPHEQVPVKVPHIGFNTVCFEKKNNELFKGLNDNADFYFVHSYRMVCSEPGDVSGWCTYGVDFAASVQKKHIFGTQFHPEKSQSNGLMVLKNFSAFKGDV
jgi:glutamine amidotransferase